MAGSQKGSAKIQGSELAEVVAGGLIVGGSGRFLCEEKTQMDRAALVATTDFASADSRRPLPALLIPKDTLETGRLVGAGAAEVSSVLGDRCDSKLRAPIVEPIAVSVVDFLTGLSLHDLTVHQDGPVGAIGLSLAAHGVERMPRALGTPMVSRELIEVGIVDDSDLALGELDRSHPSVLTTRAEEAS